MQSLFQPVVIDILGLVSQQVRAAKAKKNAVINVKNPSTTLAYISRH